MPKAKAARTAVPAQEIATIQGERCDCNVTARHTKAEHASVVAKRIAWAEKQGGEMPAIIAQMNQEEAARMAKQRASDLGEQGHLHSNRGFAMMR